MSCEILVLAPHPDDAELHCGATIASHTARGARVVIVDCTRAELSSRGDPETRADEAAAAAEALGVSARENLGLPDGGLNPADLEQRRAVVDAIRRHRPGLLLTMVGQVRHPDHRACHQLGVDATKTAALHRYATPSGAAAVLDLTCLCYQGELAIDPDVILSADDRARAAKQAALACYASQWAGSSGPETSIGRPGFLEGIDARGRAWGAQVNAPYGEAFSRMEALCLTDLRTALK
jgi:bacillithiol biosynthesis deacetylase BshB1